MSFAGTTDSVLSVRLVGGDLPFEGRVEVQQGNRWGTICDDHWTMKEAHAACQSLDFG